VKLIDAHCHIDLYRDYRSVLAEIEAEGTETIAVTNAPSVFAKFLEICTDTPYVRPAVGLHPELAAVRKKELPLLLDLLHTTHFVGEVGLDYSVSSEEERSEQRKIFGAVLTSCADLGSKVITVHSRRAAPDVVALMGANFPGALILHWYSGSLGTLAQAVANGCYFSVNPAMARSESGKKIMARIPRERLLTETDGPFVSVKGQPVRPSDVRGVIAYLAGQWHCDMEEAARVVEGNFNRILGSVGLNPRTL
jgi:TatD DNase family protein